MAKVAKNIKRLRNAKGLSQEQLAAELHISRQAVSHWENDRTQPDIDMLEKLSEVFDAPIEEIIYGERRQTTLEPDKKKPINTAAIILAVLGSLFIATGLTFVFVTGWRNFPIPVKTFFAFLPMLAGQFCAAFVYKKKINLIPWREGASVLWCAGMVATVAMINSIYDIHFGYENCLMIDGLLFLPAIFLFGAAVPLAAYYYAIIHWGIYQYSQSESVLYLILTSVLFCVGLIYLYIHKREKEEPMFKFSLWVSTAGAIALTGIISVYYSNYFIASMFACTAALTALNKNDKDYSIPFKILSLLGIIVVGFYSVMPLYSPRFYFSYTDIEKESIIGAVIIIAVTGLCIYAGRKNIKESIYSKISVSILCAWSAVEFILPYIDFVKADWLRVLLLIIYWIFTTAISINLILGGVRHSDFIEMNAGLILILLYIGYLILSAELGMLYNGLVLIVLGAVLLAVNFKLAKSVKALTDAQKEGDENA